MKPSRFLNFLGAIGLLYAPQTEVRALRSRSPTRVGRGPGDTPRQVQRAAKKRRNVQRNRRAHRG